MVRQRIFDDELFAHFVTFSCYRRRRLLDHDRAKKIVLGVLNSQLQKQNATCVGFVVMPDHVHAIVWFPVTGQLSHFMKQWKQRSSVQIKRILHASLTCYAQTVDQADSFWQRKYYAFHSTRKRRCVRNSIICMPIRCVPDWCRARVIGRGVRHGTTKIGGRLVCRWVGWIEFLVPSALRQQVV